MTGFNRAPSKFLEISLDLANLVVSITAIGTIVVYHGFSYRPGQLGEH